jgi:subfamily B ATP-binding cassette protein MsbA
VLKDVSFRAPAGSVTALVGPSGSGKSTIVGLIAGFYNASAGTVRVDGLDVTTLQLDGYRTQLGVVLQDNFLFDGTIWDNVCFAKPAATESEVLHACQVAHVQEFVERLPNRYQTIVGERGVKVSMGQRQRISIARAVLADPRILMLDEATSSLDSESEAAIQDGLSYLLKNRTTFVVAHRLSTVRRADQILVVEHGEIVECGTHEALFARRGRYYELSAKQRYGDQAVMAPQA